LGKHILILGAGFGGLATAHELRKGLGPEHKITLTDKQPLFLMGLTKLWLINETRRVGENAGNRVKLNQMGIDFIEGTVESIDAGKRIARIGNRTLQADYIIVALGADYASDEPLGISRYAKNLYTESGCAEIRDALRTFNSGTITTLVCGTPFKCPPAPYEATFIIEELLRSRGIRDKTRLQIITPEPHPLTVLGPEAGGKVVEMLKERGVDYHPSSKVMEIQRNRILTEDHKILASDLTLAVPIHVAPAVLKHSGLTDESGWLPVDPDSLASKFTGVYAVGDCAGTKIPKGALLPRAGVLAEAQGKVVAANIIHEIRGESERSKFEGRGVCWMETGKGTAAALQAHFYARPDPVWEFIPPSAQGFEDKRSFLLDRMANWFPR
jgi:sulfide:quinone oxidoreductase